MHWFNRFLNFYIDASIHVALSVSCFYLITIELLQVSTNWSLVGFLFFGTVICYNFIKYGVEAEKYLRVSNPYHRLIQFFSFLSGVFAFLFFLQLDHSLYFSIFILALLSALYAIPFLGKSKNLRNLGGLKIYLVALVWTGCTVYLPISDNSLIVSNNSFILLVQRFLLVLVLILPFEIRDLKFDSVELKTLPQRIGVGPTKKMGYVFLAVCLGLTVLKTDVLVREWWYRAIMVLILAVLLAFGSKDRSKLYVMFWVESVPIVVYVLIWTY